MCATLQKVRRLNLLVIYHQSVIDWSVPAATKHGVREGT